MSRINPLFAIDGYKLSHRQQYPAGTRKVYGNFTPRSNKHAIAPFFDGREGGAPLMWVGMQTFLLEWFGHQFKDFFFNKPAEEVVEKFHVSVNAYLGTEYPVDVFYALHAKGFLPVRIRSIPEGSVVEMKTPVFTVINTDDDFFWLPNFLETLFSAELWPVATSVTTAMNYRLQSELGAYMSCDNRDHIGFQCHDFAARGNMGMVANSLTGIGHLMVFDGTDSLYARERFNMDYPMAAGLWGWSVPATEHSVMCMGKMENEFDTYDRLLDTYPTGIISVVSDTWDFFGVLTNILPRLKDKIMARDGKLVIRPDSGDPADIICGREVITPPEDLSLAEIPMWIAGQNVSRTAVFKHDGKYYQLGQYLSYNNLIEVSEEEVKGAIQLLWEVFGGTKTSDGFKVLDQHIGLIYGDSITLYKQQEIFDRLIINGFATSNVVLGIGSFAYQYVTRDSYGFAMKATWGLVGDEPREIFKAPKTDDGTKKSAKGLMRHYRDEFGNWKFQDGVDEEMEENTELPIVYEDGVITTESGDDIRRRVNDSIEKLFNWKLEALGLRR